MREILFRGKKVNKDKWIYGVPVKATSHDESEMLIIYDVFECEEYNCRGCNFDPVLPETVGQYTGLTDKNGKKIFEGDMVNIEFSETTVTNAVITYVGASFYGDTDFDSWELDGYVSLEVIGNIHDNPELLKGE